MRMIMMGVFAIAGAACVAPAPARAETPTAYVAKLVPMDSKVTGLDATGEARFTVSGDRLTIRITAKGAPPDIVHWQHFQGFKDGRVATCPTAAADVNHDGIIDLIETEPAAGTTMVPFDDNPAGMDVARDMYPAASAAGTYDYQQVVSLKVLRTAFAKAFGSPDLDLDRRVIFVHGIPPTTKLPASVASLGTIPAQVTLPIACGKIERIGQ
ncbi:MAG: hypothetical protein WBM24_07605 [Candidatus Sulfotelmatobacter sp.]